MHSAYFSDIMWYHCVLDVVELKHIKVTNDILCSFVPRLMWMVGVHDSGLGPFFWRSHGCNLPRHIGGCPVGFIRRGWCSRGCQQGAAWGVRHGLKDGAMSVCKFHVPISCLLRITGGNPNSRGVCVCGTCRSHHFLKFLPFWYQPGFVVGWR